MKKNILKAPRKGGGGAIHYIQEKRDKNDYQLLIGH